MLIAGIVDLEDCLRQLAAERPVFHSEADFQLALAWRIKERDGLAEVRLETRPGPGVHLDLSVRRRDLGRWTALELKYLTRAWSGVVGTEHFELKNHGAHDIRAYDVVKDITRVEQFVSNEGAGANGAVVVITNDASFGGQLARTTPPTQRTSG